MLWQQTGLIFFSCPTLTVPHSPATAEVTQLVEFVSPPVLAALNEQYFIPWAALTAINIPVAVCSFGKPLLEAFSQELLCREALG